MKRTVRSQPILRTKLLVPQLKPDTLRRQRVLDLIVNQLDRRLIVITGDAGYGKTTLLAQIIGTARLPGVFILLEQEDSDLVTFFSCLVDGLERLQPGLAQRCRGLVDHGTDIGKNYRLAMGTLINELMEKRSEELFLFLDDYHALSDGSEVHQALDYFINHLPASIHVVLASRKEPPLPSLAKWRAKRDLAELTREGLKFTGDEIQALLGQFYSISLSEPELADILQRTEGWITGVQLILQAAGRDGKSIRETLKAYLDDHGDLFRYFAGEIFNRETADMQNFLRRSAVLESMTPEACRIVLQAGNPARNLEQLAESNLFVTVTGDGEYRYHRLFREFLYDQLTDPEERQELQTRAAEYFESRGQPAKAVEQYLSAGRHREAVALIRRERERMINRAQFALLQSWLDRLPAPAYNEYPWLYALKAVLCKEQGKLEQAGALYQQAEVLLRGQGQKDASLASILHEKSIVLHRKGESKEALAVLRQAFECCAAGDVAMKISIMGFTSQVWVEGFGDIQKARSYLDRARRLLKDTDDKLQAVYLDQKKAVLFERAGEKRQAFKIYKSIIDQINGNYFHQVGSYFHNAAKIALDLGQTDWAGDCLNKGQSLCQGYEDVFSRSMLEFGFGYLYLYRGQWDKAQAHLESARNIFEEMNWTRSVCIALRQLGRLCRYQGNQDAARQYIDRMKQQALGPQDQTAMLMELALIEAARGKYLQARETLAACGDQPVKYFGKMGDVMTCLTEAAISAGLKKQPEASRWFRKAAELSKDFGFNGLLSCELRASPLLRRTAEKCGPERAYLLTIPSYQPAGGTPPAPAPEACLQVELLGPPRLHFGGKEITGAFRRQALQVLFFLAYHRERGASRDEIVQAMWPRAKPKQAVDNFHLVLFEVRQGLSKAIGKFSGKAVAKECGRYRIGRGLRVVVDAQAFEELLAQSAEAERNGDLAAAKNILKNSLNLDQGGCCCGWTGDWALELSRRYEDMHQKALLKLGALHLRDGDVENSRECYERAIARDELCEEGYRGLIRVYGSQGNLIEVRAAFDQLQKVLRKELKAEPSPETMELYRTAMSANK